MSTIEPHGLVEGVSVEVTGAERISAYTLRLHFSDGASRELDFEPFLQKSARPEIRQFQDLSRFAGFRIQDGELVWGDYEMCFPIADLYDGKL